MPSTRSPHAPADDASQEPEGHGRSTLTADDLSGSSPLRRIAVPFVL
jgi:hypothetical protein